MSLSPAARDRRRVRRPVLAVTCAAWLALLLGDAMTRGPGGHAGDAVAGAARATAPGVTTAGHGGIHAVTVDVSGTSTITLTGFLSGWVLMVVAMMAPLLIPALRHVHARSLPRRRSWAMGVLTLGYVGTWVAAGLVLLMLAVGVSAMADRAGGALLVGVVVAVSWQASPLRQRCLTRRRALPPLAAFGRRAYLGALRFGLTHGAWCVGTCWAVMLLLLVVPARHVPLMVIASLWLWSEELERPAGPGWGLRVPVRPLRIAGERALTGRGR